MTHLRLAFARLAAPTAALLLCLPAAAQGWLVTDLSGDPALDALMPAPQVRVQVRAGNKAPGGDHELAILVPSQASSVTAQHKWQSGQVLPFRVAWDGLHRVTLDVGGQVLVRDVPGGFHDLALRAASSRAGSRVTLQGLDLNGKGLGSSPSAFSADGSTSVAATLVQGADLASGFVLRGQFTLAWKQPGPKGDELLLELLLGDLADLGQQYCLSLPNSTGAACHLSWWGVPSLSSRSLWFEAVGGVPSAPCLFLTSDGAHSQPFGNGWLCIGPQIDRLGTVQAFDPQGRLLWPVPFDLSPIAGLQAGDVRKFQLWYRDAQASPESFNLSDAISLLFVP